MMDELLDDARNEFKKRRQEYQGIIVCFSGHGSEHHLLLSNIRPKQCKHKYCKCMDQYKSMTDYEYIMQDYEQHGGVYLRKDFEQYFNGKKVEQHKNDYKFFFVDACRGSVYSNLLPPSVESNVRVKGNVNRPRQKGVHPEAHKCIMYSNTIIMPHLRHLIINTKRHRLGKIIRYK